MSSNSTIGEVGKVAKTIFDPITKFWEGIAQIGYAIFSDRSVVELLILYVLGMITFSTFMNKFEQLIKEDADERDEARRAARLSFFKLCHKYGAKILKESIGAAYKYLKKQTIMSNPKLREFLHELEVKREEYKQKKEIAKARRRWGVRIGIPLCVLLLWIANMSSNTQVTLAIMIVCGGMLAGTGYLVYRKFFSNNPTPPAPLAGHSSEGGAS